MKRWAIPVVLALASAGAGAIHLKVVPEHLEEFTPFGVGFIALGVFQLLWAAAVLIRPTMLVLAIGLIVSALTIGVWVVSRTVGLPFGPEAGEPEAIGTLDVLSTALEGLVVLGAGYLMLRPAGEKQPAAVPAYRQQDRRAA
jgi:hypothetical protein